MSYTVFSFAAGRSSFTVEQVVCVGALRILARAAGCFEGRRLTESALCRKAARFELKSLILAQIERWRHA